MGEGWGEMLQNENMTAGSKTMSKRSDYVS